MKPRSDDRSWLVPFAGSLLFVACYALIMWVHPWSDDRISDIRLYAGVAHSIQIGRLPYRDFLFGYPPLGDPGDDPRRYRRHVVRGIPRHVHVVHAARRDLARAR